jgi:hypothetical protein
MRALFGDRDGDLTNSSPQSQNPEWKAVVLDVKVFSRLEEGNDLDDDNNDSIIKLKLDLAERRRR